MSSATTTSHEPPTDQQGPNRPMWRRRLVEFERGLALGIRNDGALFVWLFGAVVVGVGGLVLGLNLLEWTLVVLALTGVLAAELFRQVLKLVCGTFGHHFAETAQKTLRIATAAVYVTVAGSGLAIGLLLANRVRQLLLG